MMFTLRHVLPDGKRGMTHTLANKRELRNVLGVLRTCPRQDWFITRDDGVIIAQSKTFTPLGETKRV